MCGVAGYAGLGYLSSEMRYDLVEALGEGIDARGGHASGAVVIPAVDEGYPRLMRRLGKWQAAKGRFIRAASAGHSVMMHARWATHGSKDDVNNAHPFAVKRTDLEGKEVTVLYGCHNGVLQGTYASAREHGREHTVDSREFLELLADGEYDLIRKLEGYGVVTYVKPEDRKVRVVKLSSSADFEVSRLAGGGLVWASTSLILRQALEYIGVKDSERLSVAKVGTVYMLSGKEATETKLDGITVQSGNSGYMSWQSYGYDSANYSKHSAPRMTGHIGGRSPATSKDDEEEERWGSWWRDRLGKDATIPPRKTVGSAGTTETGGIRAVGSTFSYSLDTLSYVMRKIDDGTYRKDFGGITGGGFPVFIPTTKGKYDPAGSNFRPIRTWDEGLGVGLIPLQLRQIIVGRSFSERQWHPKTAEELKAEAATCQQPDTKILEPEEVPQSEPATELAADTDTVPDTSRLTTGPSNDELEAIDNGFLQIPSDLDDEQIEEWRAFMSQNQHLLSQ